MGYFRLINLTQTKEERKEKYFLARSLGCNSSWASTMRDWRLSKIERLFRLTDLHFQNNGHIECYAQFRLPDFPHAEDLR